MLRKLLLSIGLLCITLPLNAQVTVSDRHMVILNTGVDAIWGNYLFLISNPGSEAAPFAMDLLLPAETSDWQALDNLDPADIKLGPDGGVRLEKTVPPGDLLVSVGFKVQGSGGEATLSFEPRAVDGSLTFLVNDKALKINGSQLAFRANQPFQNGRLYDTYTIEKLSASRNYKLFLNGIPEGRSRFWLMGWVVFASLLFGALLMAWYTRKNHGVSQGALKSHAAVSKEEFGL
jgi:hypothetical protein